VTDAPTDLAPEDLDVMSRAFHAALEVASLEDCNRETAKAAAMNSILAAVRSGERNAERLKAGALEAIRRCEERGISPVMQAPAL
jgi:hypothetical protein